MLFFCWHVSTVDFDKSIEDKKYRYILFWTTLSITLGRIKALKIVTKWTLASLLEYLSIHNENYISSDRKGRSMASSWALTVSHNSSLLQFLVGKGVKKSLNQRERTKTRTSTEEWWEGRNCSLIDLWKKGMKLQQKNTEKRLTMT